MDAMTDAPGDVLTEVVAEAARHRGLHFAAKYGTVVFLLGLIIFFSIAQRQYFLTVTNFKNILDQAALGAIVAAGATIVLVAGDFDLSVGNMASLAGVVVVGLLGGGTNLVFAVALVLLLGAAIGTVNGLIVTKLRVNALVATLGSGSLITGLIYAYTDGIPKSLGGTNHAFANISIGMFLGFRNTVWIMLAVYVGLWILLNRTALGQELQAIGGNVQAATLAGIRVDRLRVVAFVISASFAALAGIILASRVSSGQITAGDGFLLSAYAAAFLGSAVLRDGEFHIVGTFIGVMVVAVGQNGLSLMDVPAYVRFMFTGAVLIIAVALSTGARRAVGEAGS
jgi:ribose transport system permease protein